MKNLIRNQSKEKRNHLTDYLVNEYSEKVSDRLFDLDEFKKCTMLFTYVSFGNEVDTHKIINRAIQMNKHVYVPRVENNECLASQDTLMLNELNFYEIRSLDNLIRSNYGILEPDGNVHHKYTSISDNRYKLMLLPGLAFDMEGNRIGYGAGYYDRYLGKLPHDEWIKIALAYDFQIVNRLSVGIYDVPADFIVTPERLIICRE